ncbi:MAG: BrnA antitoxin family protein [Nitrospirota bacterium]|nr:BrnA antitoxin family protein [Nitrospirota bacterium]MDE3242762.1 BrnA antitoxin family protein [Nitrospirota bacterium]
MKKQYDFSQGKRGAVVPTPPGKTRITIRLDDDILDWFRAQVHAAGGGNYQTLINTALQDYIAHRREPLEDTLRRVLREELPKKGARPPKVLQRTG